MNNSAKVEQASHGEGLEQVQERFKHWREARERGQHIPLHLWGAAVSLAKKYGLSYVANELGVNHDSLKKRLNKAEDAFQTSELATQFVELKVAPIPVFAPQSQSECVIELSNARGAKMRVELNGNGLAGLAGLCNTFWRAA